MLLASVEVSLLGASQVSLLPELVPVLLTQAVRVDIVPARLARLVTAIVVIGRLRGLAALLIVMLLGHLGVDERLLRLRLVMMLVWLLGAVAEGLLQSLLVLMLVRGQLLLEWCLMLRLVMRCSGGCRVVGDYWRCWVVVNIMLLLGQILWLVLRLVLWLWLVLWLMLWLVLWLVLCLLQRLLLTPTGNNWLLVRCNLALHSWLLAHS